MLISRNVVLENKKPLKADVIEVNIKKRYKDIHV